MSQGNRIGAHAISQCRMKARFSDDVHMAAQQCVSTCASSTGVCAASCSNPYSRAGLRRRP